MDTFALVTYGTVIGSTDLVRKSTGKEQTKDIQNDTLWAIDNQ